LGRLETQLNRDGEFSAVIRPCIADFAEHYHGAVVLANNAAVAGRGRLTRRSRRWMARMPIFGPWLSTPMDAAKRSGSPSMLTPCRQFMLRTISPALAVFTLGQQVKVSAVD